MAIIDADAHVVEIDETWEYLAPNEREYKPGVVYEKLETGETLKFWIIGDQRVPTPWPGGGSLSDALTEHSSTTCHWTSRQNTCWT